ATAVAPRTRGTSTRRPPAKSTASSPGWRPPCTIGLEDRMNRVDTPQTRCRAGVAGRDITPPVGIYHRMWGAAVHDRATGVHRPLTATLLWLEPLESGRERGQLIAALDHCVFDHSEVQRMQRAVGEAAGLAAEQIQITLSHT